MIHMSGDNVNNVNKIDYIVGDENRSFKPLLPFSESVCRFLDDLSKELRNDIEAKKYPDILSFAFWCRKGNIQTLKKKCDDTHIRIGRGLVFHIAPSNVPVNFAFSYAFGLLAGNANIVRVPSGMLPQTKIICRCIRQVIEKKEYIHIKNMTKIVSYERNDKINDDFSSECQARVIWGGDITIREIRRSQMNVRSIDIAFADRYSIGVIDAEYVLKSSEDEMKKLAQDFYNDTYLMDQNACSSPQIIFWKSFGAYTEKAQERFWKYIYNEAKKYDLADIKVSEKYSRLCAQLAESEHITDVKKYDNLLYVISLSKPDKPLEKQRGRYGMFFQYNISSTCEIMEYITEKVQTCLYFGELKKELAESIIEKGVLGIDRIVPFGKGLDIGIVWDGYDLLNQLTRIVDVQ